MIFREALVTDIPQMHAIRVVVKENILPDPGMITPADYEEFLTVRGKGWVCEIEHAIAGFAIIDLQQKNIWALFVHPSQERKGIGRQLQQTMLNWYFENNHEAIWLGTGPATRAEHFYRLSGWIETGRRSNGEIKFEMTRTDWRRQTPE